MDIKVGGRFVLTSNHLESYGGKVGDTLTLTKIEDDGCHEFRSDSAPINLYLFPAHIKPYQDYETSNRKKLKDAVIKTGFSSKDLSIAMGFNDNYLSGYISKSRMSERGDISEEQLNSLKVSILFAERTLNGTGAETVDELKFGDAKFECSSNITEADKKEINVALDDIISDLWEGKYDQRGSKNHDDHVDALSYAFLNSQKHKSKYSNFIKLQKLAFAMCFTMVILLISILYFVVSK